MACQVAPGWLDPYVLGRYLSGVGNDAFNDMEVIASCCLTTSRACVALRRVIHREWASGRHYTIAACCEWPADQRCPVAILQTPYPHVLLAFNVLPVVCLACA
jgi:hypothetical protein